MKKLWKKFWGMVWWTIKKFFWLLGFITWRPPWWILRKIGGGIRKNKGIITRLFLIALGIYGGIHLVQFAYREVTIALNTNPEGTVEQVQVPTKDSRNLVPSNKKPGTKSKEDIKPPSRVEKGEYTTPVRGYTPQARWVSSAKMYRDQNGFFITAPGVIVEGKNRFDEFAKAHPEQAQRILSRR